MTFIKVMESKSCAGGSGKKNNQTNQTNHTNNHHQPQNPHSDQAVVHSQYLRVEKKKVKLNLETHISNELVGLATIR